MTNTFHVALQLIEATLCFYIYLSLLPFLSGYLRCQIKKCLSKVVANIVEQKNSNEKGKELLSLYHMSYQKKTSTA